MPTYTVSSHQLAPADIYDIREVTSLAEFLKNNSSLCIVKTPFDGSIAEMTRVEGKNSQGEPARIYLGCCSEKDQGYLKSKLDRTLHSAYLFIAWKQKGYHTFKLVKERQVIAEFADFQSALENYFREGFVPEKSFRRAHTVFSLMCKTLKRRSLFKQLATILNESKNRREKDQ